MYKLEITTDDINELKIYTNAMDNYCKLVDIYGIARNYDKHTEPTEENYYKLCEEIREISYFE